MTATALVAMTFFHFFNTTWSNHCDPGNAQFNLLKSDPSVSFRAQDEMWTWESDEPDNSWLCTNPTLSLDHVGSNVKAIYDETRSNLSASGWTEQTSQYSPPDQAYTLFEKNLEGGVRLTAFVQQEAFWVEVNLDAPGLHLGEPGFSGTH